MRWPNSKHEEGVRKGTRRFKEWALRSNGSRSNWFAHFAEGNPMPLSFAQLVQLQQTDSPIDRNLPIVTRSQEYINMAVAEDPSTRFLLTSA